MAQALLVLLFLGACGDRQGADCAARVARVRALAGKPRPSPVYLPLEAEALPTAPAGGPLTGAGELRVWIGDRGVKIHQAAGWIPLAEARPLVEERLEGVKVVDVGLSRKLLVGDVAPLLLTIADKATLRLIVAPPPARLELPADTPPWARDRIAEVQRTRQSQLLAEGMTRALGACTAAREVFGRLAAQGPDRLDENLGAAVDAVAGCGCRVVDVPAFDAFMATMLHVGPPPGWRVAPLRRRGGAALRLPETASVQELVDALSAGPPGDRTLELTSSESP